MCTVTFIARRTGFALGMNRDEKLTRPVGLPPRKSIVNGRAVICPWEPLGGTWIALNDGGVCLALINWYSVPSQVRRVPLSRGEVVKLVCSAESFDHADARLQRLPLARINPFRLIGIFPMGNEIFEWRWDSKRLVRKKRPWKTQQWISSGFDETTAQRVRNRSFQRALRQRSAGGLQWLRRLHRSHSPRASPFSTCMHRADASTVSYTEINVSGQLAKMGYHSGALCSRKAMKKIGLRLGGRGG